MSIQKYWNKQGNRKENNAERAICFRNLLFYPQFDCSDGHGRGEWNDHSHHMPPLVGTRISSTSVVIRVIAVVIVIIMIMIIVTNVFMTIHNPYATITEH